ncbi:MAG: alpha/beta hydrolase [Candidatus Rokuibacteriota bacterium]
MSAATAAAAGLDWTEEDVRVAGLRLPLKRAGSGEPLLLLHRDTGSLDALPAYEALARRFTLYRPSHPGYDGAERPDWMRSVRDIAVCYQWLLAERKLANVTLVGLGFGGWIAAEMATMAPAAFSRLVLVGAMGLKPATGDILDQALLSYIDYARAGFDDQAVFDRVYGAEPVTSQLEQWDLNREMSFRIAWKPYMYSLTLPHLLGGVSSPALVVWGRRDRVVPLACGEQYARALPRARLAVVEGAGHSVEIEQPDAFVKLIADFAAQA